MGNVLAPLGQICCQTNAQLILIAYSYPCFQDSSNTDNPCCLNSSHLTITFIWRLLTPDNSFHQQTIQTIGWQSSGSQLPVCKSITAKNQMVWQFLPILGFMSFEVNWGKISTGWESSNAFQKKRVPQALANPRKSTNKSKEYRFKKKNQWKSQIRVLR